MKLSEMNTDQLADALVDLTEPMANIAKDEELNKALNDMAENRVETQTVLQKVSSIVTIFLPAILKRHRADAYLVLSALTGKTVNELAEQRGMQTIKDAREVIDKELIDFFKSSGT